MRITVISASLNPGSKSRVLGWEAFEQLKVLGVDADFLDLQEFPLPMAGSDRSWEDPNVKALTERLHKAEGILMSAPIYTYDLSAAAKNLVELTGEAWEGKVVGFLCAAGGQASYMSVMSFANSLMLDFRCMIVPRFVYAVKETWDGVAIKDEKVKARIAELAAEVTRVTAALSKTASK